MKKFIIATIAIVFSLNLHAESMFASVDNYIEDPSANANIHTGQRLLSLYSRMSFYALTCGSTQDNIKFSNLYKAHFTELSKGQVSFRGQIFPNPIEKMRNKAAIDFYSTENEVGGRKVLCEQNRAEFEMLINMTPQQVLNHVNTLED